MYTSITTNELFKLLKQSEINLIDVREPYEYNLGHINRATNIPTNEILSNFAKLLNQDEQYYIICQSGGRSAYVCEILNSQGYQVINILGGNSSLANQIK